MRYVTALTIAGSDCSGGAGIQADIKTMSALGVYSAAVITAVTVQNTLGVQAVEPVEPGIVAAQIHAVMRDIKPMAVKIGMVCGAETIDVIADALAGYDVRNLVVDPIMVSSSGMRLMEEEAVEVFCRRLLPMSSVLTPNIPEAEVISGIPITDEAACDEAGRSIAARCKTVLIKGGHAVGKVKTDRLYAEERLLMSIEGATIETRNTHGTGCTLSAAITSFLACGKSPVEACKGAKEYITKALQTGSDITIGAGFGPVNHFFNPERLKVY